MRLVALFIILVAICSCNSQTANRYPQQILGSWQFVKYGELNEDRMGDKLIKTEIGLKKGMVIDFARNNVCCYRGRDIISDNAVLNADTAIQQSTYKLIGDSLGLADGEKKIHWVKIAYMDADTMIVYLPGHYYAKAAKLRIKH